MQRLFSNPSPWDFLGLIGAGQHNNADILKQFNTSSGRVASPLHDCGASPVSLWHNSNTWEAKSIGSSGCVGHLAYVVQPFEKKSRPEGLTVYVVVVQFPNADDDEDFNKMTNSIKQSLASLGVEDEANVLVLARNQRYNRLPEDIMKAIVPSSGRTLSSQLGGTCCSTWHDKDQTWSHPYDRIMSNFGVMPDSIMTTLLGPWLPDRLETFDVDKPVTVSFGLCEHFETIETCQANQCHWDGSCRSPLDSCSQTLWGSSCEPDPNFGTCQTHLEWAVSKESKSCPDALKEISSQCLACSVCSPSNCP